MELMFLIFAALILSLGLLAEVIVPIGIAIKDWFQGVPK